jgi:hypothetical protein
MVILNEHEDAGMSEVERAAANAVVDLDAESLTCPACLTAFSQEQGLRCPECGLNFGG